MKSPIEFPSIARRLARGWVCAVPFFFPLTQNIACGHGTALHAADVSFLWPVPKNKFEVEQLISLADSCSDGPLVPTAVFNSLIEQAKQISRDDISISFLSDQFSDPKNWKVCGLRINPTALGTAPAALARGEVPGIRVIVQPVIIKGERVTVHDIAAHVVFNYIKPIESGQPVKPDRVAFQPIVDDLRLLKKDFRSENALPTEALGVHPGFLPDQGALTSRLRIFIQKHLSSARLDQSQAAAISFMGIPSRFEPWIFFKVVANTTEGTVALKNISGRYGQEIDLTNQMISFFPDVTGKVLPAPEPPLALSEVSTARFFPNKPLDLTAPLFPELTELEKFKVCDIPDIVANPQLTTTLSTDCVSCHTESTLRHLRPGLESQTPEVLFTVEGIAQQSAALPKDRWNVRNFGWGFNFDGADDAPKGFHPTVSQRAANEALESAAFISSNY